MDITGVVIIAIRQAENGPKKPKNQLALLGNMPYINNIY
jgi:hypothetical protein